MPLLILMAILALPLIEIAVFIEVGQGIGGGWVILLTLATAFFGLALVRQQGLGVMQRMDRSMQAGEPPVREVIDGVFLVLAGFFLFFPGFLTDMAGALLLIPPVRQFLGGLGLARMVVTSSRGWQRSTGRSGHTSKEGPVTIDAEFYEKAANDQNDTDGDRK